MQVRFPAFDFSTATPAWGVNREATVIINAGADFNRKHLAEHTAAAAAYLYEVDYDPGTIAPPRDYDAMLARYSPA